MSTMAWPHCGHSMFRFPPSPQFIFFFLHRPTSASTFSPVLSFINVAASSDTASCTAPVSLSLWIVPPHAHPTPLTDALLSLSVLVRGVGFVTWAPSCTTNSIASLSISI